MEGRRTVVHVVTRYLRGGSEQRIRDIVRCGYDARHIVVVGRDSDAELARRELGVPVIVEPRLVRELDPRSDLAAVARITAVLRATRCDLVVTHQSKAGAVGRLSARRAGRVRVLHSLSMASFGDGYGARGSLVYSFVERALARWTYAYAVVGTDLAARFESAGIPGTKLRVVRSAVELPRGGRGEGERPSGWPRSRPVVLYIGSLEPRKHVLDLLALLGDVTRRTRGARPFLAIAGDGPLHGALRAEIARRGLTNDVALLGYVRAVEPLLRAARVVVLLSSAEGLPQVLVQAAAVGTPFVSYDVDGVHELLELGAEGRVVPLLDLDAASDAVAEMLSRPGAPRPPRVDLSSWSTDRIDEAYRELLDDALRGTGVS